MTSDAANLLNYLFDAEYVVYVVDSQHIFIDSFYTSTITTTWIDWQMEDRLQTLRAKKIGSLRIIRAHLLENRLLKEIPADQARRWWSRPVRRPQ